METFKLKPKQGLSVLDPVTYTPLNAKGETKPKNAYWLSRLRDGDVEQVKSNSNKEKK